MTGGGLDTEGEVSTARVRAIGHGFLDRTLPKAEWTHAAHFAATLFLLRERTDIDLDQDLPDLIRTYNIAAGGTNTDHEGYHETITRVFLAAVRAFLRERPSDEPLGESWAALMADPRSAKDYPLRFYSRDRLFSVEARRTWIAPHLAAEN